MIIREGNIQLEIPKDFLKKRHFYNPKMELSRDLSILLLNNMKTKDWIVCDVLTGIGARGIRIAQETDVEEVWLNDANYEVLNFARKNVKINKLNNKVKIYNKDGNVLLSENIKSFNHIDLDPFGSPVFYFDSCVRAIRDKGLIGITATDLGTLSGRYPTTCIRRYGIKNFRTDFYRELGIRILIGSFAQSAGRWNMSFSPLLSYWNEHYYRVFGVVKESKTITGKFLKCNLGWINYCQRCYSRKIDHEFSGKCEFCGNTMIGISHTWIGSIQDEKFIEACLKSLERIDWLNTEKKIRQLLQSLKCETIPLYYDIHEICKKHKLRIPKFEQITRKLKEENFMMSRTHFCRTGLKTDADLKNLLKIIEELT